MDIVLDAPIIGVTVYPERALVVRRGTATIEAPGEHILRVLELPQSTVQRNSFRATGSGPAGTRILGIEQASEFHAAPPEETLSRLRDEIARLKSEIALVDERVNILDEQRGWLRNLGEHAARTIAYGISRGTAKAEEAGNVFAYSSQEAERLVAGKIDLNRRRQELQDELEARERELRELGGTKLPDRLAAMVRISVTTPGAVEIQLSYLVVGAMWRPRYDARVDIATQRVRLTQQAIINQRTDEDWSQVALA
ncbi:MAG TPA: mucoidy inhibitor MuiA family protein, partial [Ktedonobacterales bacterium]